MFRSLALILIGITAGYFIRGYFDSRGIDVREMTKNAIIPNNPVKHDSFTTEMTYTDGDFKPKSVTVRKGNYFILKNTSNSLMWIVSDYPELNTVRGYARSEEVRIRADRSGSFTISNKLNIKAGATLTVAAPNTVQNEN